MRKFGLKFWGLEILCFFLKNWVSVWLRTLVKRFLIVFLFPTVLYTQIYWQDGRNWMHITACLVLKTIQSTRLENVFGFPCQNQSHRVIDGTTYERDTLVFLILPLSHLHTMAQNIQCTFLFAIMLFLCFYFLLFGCIFYPFLFGLIDSYLVLM